MQKKGGWEVDSVTFIKYTVPLQPYLGLQRSSPLSEADRKHTTLVRPPWGYTGLFQIKGMAGIIL